MFQYLVSRRVKKALATTEPGVISPDPSQPSVAPEDASIFPEEMMLKLEFYKEKVLLVEDFEGFSDLVTHATQELLLGVSETEKVAAIFNRFRLEAGKDPI
jgi:hypothetical protein